MRIGGPPGVCGRGVPGQIGDAVVLALEVHRRLVGEQRLQDLGVLDHPIDAHLGRVHRDAGAVVVELLPPRAEADLEPALRQHVDRRQLAREHRGMAVVAVEHERADVQRGGDARPPLAIAVIGPSPSSKWSGTNSVE